MKIAFITQDDPIYILPFFDEFFRQELGEINVVAIFSCKTMGDRGRLQLLGELRYLYGVAGLLRLLARRTALTVMQGLPAKAGARRFHSVAQICRVFQIPHRYIGNPNREEFRSRIASFHPDLLVSIACPYILKEKLLTLPPLGCINLHHAPLPHYRGMMPTFWQMYHGEKKVGLTIHRMTSRLDQGKALLQAYLSILPDESLDSLIRRTKREGARCMVTVLREIARNKQSNLPLQDEPGSYFTFPTATQMKEFRQRGFRAI